MRNIKTTIKAGTLIIEVKTNEKGTPSASGKSEVIATSSGNIEVPGVPGLKFGLTVYKPIKK